MLQVQRIHQDIVRTRSRPNSAAPYLYPSHTKSTYPLFCDPVLRSRSRRTNRLRATSNLHTRKAKVLADSSSSVQTPRTRCCNIERFSLLVTVPVTPQQHHFHPIKKPSTNIHYNNIFSFLTSLEGNWVDHILYQDEFRLPFANCSRHVPSNIPLSIFHLFLCFFFFLFSLFRRCDVVSNIGNIKLYVIFRLNSRELGFRRCCQESLSECQGLRIGSCCRTATTTSATMFHSGRSASASPCSPKRTERAVC